MTMSGANTERVRDVPGLGLTAAMLDRAILEHVWQRDLAKALRLARQAGETAPPSLVWLFWLREAPDVMARLDAEVAARWQDRTWEWGLDVEPSSPPALSQAACATEFAKIAQAPWGDVLLRHPLLCRAFGQGTRYLVPFAVRGGFECGVGWRMLIDAVCGDLETLAVALKRSGVESIPRLTQVKEKFGLLRIAVSDVPASLWPVVRRRLEAAEAASLTVCEGCGAPGALITTGWRRVSCEQCR